ncbi:MAG: hypothetical protein WB696_31010 [Chthoniobacterales bacterium]
MKKIDYGEIYHHLGDDLRALNTLWDSGQNEMGRRVFAIFVFSTFESIGWLLVSYVNKGIPTYGKGGIEDWQLAAAKSKESEEVDPVAHINFALKYAASFHGTKDFKPSKVSLWEHVEPAKKVRNRVVHPKTIESLRVTVKEHISCKCSLAWLWNCLTVLKIFDENPGTTFREVLKDMPEAKIIGDFDGPGPSPKRPADLQSKNPARA